jgi:hypothetical protein
MGGKSILSDSAKLKKGQYERQTEIMRENISLIQRIQKVNTKIGEFHPQAPKIMPFSSSAKS